MREPAAASEMGPSQFMNSSLLLSLTVHRHQNLLAAFSSVLRHRDNLPLVLKSFVGNVAEFRE